MKHLLLAPFTMHDRVLELIRREARHAREGKPARIIAKMNALVEEAVIRALYAASQAGVEIDLIVRGACALRPGVPGFSENIRVRSVIGRFLEHTASGISRTTASRTCGSRAPTGWAATSSGGSRSRFRCSTRSCKRA